MTPEGPDVVTDGTEPSSDLVAAVGSPTTTARGLRGSTTRGVTYLVDHVSRYLDRWLGEGARWAHLPQRRRVGIGWVVSRLVMLALLAGPESGIINDVLYYGDNLQRLSDTGSLATVLHEYPLPVLVLVGLPWLVSFGNHIVYATLFVVMLLAIDLVFLRLLFRFGGGRQTAAVTLWIAAGPMMGPLAVTRFDLVPGVLAGAAVLLVATRPRLAALLVTAGAALKLWPAMLLPALAAPLRTRSRVITTAVAASLVIVATSVAIGGLERLTSPLQWQSQRGLQIESVPALPLMAGWALFRHPWTVEFTKYVTSEVHGPGGRVMLTLATLATIAAVLAMAYLWLRAWRKGRSIGAETVGWLMLTTAGLLILTNKVFSPQYLLWLSPIAIAMVALAPRSDTGVRRFAVLLLTVGVLTQVIYPIFYLWVSEVYWANPLGILLLGIRDGALVGFVVYAGRRAWVETARSAVTPTDA